MLPDKAIESLGTPLLKLAGFQLWIHGRQFPESRDHWDGNWLNVTSHCGAAGASIWASGAIITTMDIEKFSAECERLYKGLAAEATIDPVEPNLHLSLRTTDSLGHIRMLVEITQDHMSQKHELSFEIDQSYLPEVISQCRAAQELSRARLRTTWCDEVNETSILDTETHKKFNWCPVTPI